jgi:hypothetical protein
MANSATINNTPSLDPGVFSLSVLRTLASYIAGLFEGDGHIWIPSTTHAPSGKRYTPRFHITFALKDLPLAQYLSVLLGGVQIRIKEAEGACVLTINSIPVLILIVNLLNGLLRTPKIEQFNALIGWLNENGYGPFTVSPVNTSSIFSNSWLAGFIDADGGFKVRITQLILGLFGKVLRKGRIACSFVLEQRMYSTTGLSYLPILTAMCDAFGCKLNTSLHGGREYFVFNISSMAQLALLVAYLDQHTLLSSKYLDYCDWRQVYLLIRDGRHLTVEGALLIAEYKSHMNNSRTVYTWDHLPTQPRIT